MSSPEDFVAEEGGVDNGEEGKALLLMAARDRFSATANGMELPASFVHVLVEAMGKNLEDQADLEGMPPIMVVAMVEAYYAGVKGKALPPALKLLLMGHVGLVGPAVGGDVKLLDAGLVGTNFFGAESADETIPIKKNELWNAGFDNPGRRDEAIRQDIEESCPGISARLAAIAFEDCVAQGLSIREIIALSASVEMGKVVQPHEVKEESYSGDPRAYKAVRGATKYDQRTLSKLLEKGSWSECCALVADVSRDYSQQGHPKQAMLITTFWTETVAGFGSDDKSALAYVKAYRRMYSGRGFPEPWAERMAVRARNSVREAAGPVCSKEDVQKMVASATKDVMAECDKLRNQLAVVSRRGPTGQGKGAGKGAGGAGNGKGKAERLANMVCYKCEQTGHMARDCPSGAAEAEE